MHRNKMVEFDKAEIALKNIRSFVMMIMEKSEEVISVIK
jgi:hypothetical protein